MRVAIVADSHWDETSRWDECQRVHQWIAEDLSARGVDLVLHAGDIFERKSTPRERAAVAEWLRTLAATAPVVIVRGNHDAVGDLAIFSRLRTAHPVVVEEGAGIHRVAGVEVACLAWPRKAEVLAGAGATAREIGEQDAAEALRSVLRGLGAGMEGAPRIVLAHAMVRGSRTSTGQPLVGCDLEIGLDDLALCRADLYALGHIHLPQDWEINAAPAIYPGSPRRTAFGEVEEKGYVVAEFDGPRLVGWERVPTPCAGMVLIEVDLREGSPMLPEALDVAGAEARYRYTVDADGRAGARVLAECARRDLLAAGAISVKIEEVVRATSTARAPEIATTADLGDKLRALWRVRGDVPAAERGERLVSMARGIESEVRHGA